jgi:hypothetical protein
VADIPTRNVHILCYFIGDKVADDLGRSPGVAFVAN